MEIFSVEDRVFLHNKITSWCPEPRFPVKGSTHECVGTIVAVQGVRARVDWDNGQILPTIPMAHLCLAKEEDVISIW